MWQFEVDEITDNYKRKLELNILEHILMGSINFREEGLNARSSPFALGRTLVKNTDFLQTLQINRRILLVYV